MRKNMHLIDRVVRILIAVTVFYLIYNETLMSPWSWILGVLSVVFVLTSLINWCPIYTMLGISTAPKSKDA